MRNSRRGGAAAALLAALFAIGGSSQSAAAGDPSPSVDPAARRIAAGLWEALGGQSGFDRARALHFTFTVSRADTVRAARSHWWDRFDGRYRVQARTRDGHQVLLLFSAQDRQGQAWLDGVLQEGEAHKQWLERGYAWFINDTYWLLMPAKLLDPGVRLATDGEVRVRDALCDRVKVTFENVGLTPGDTYWAYVDRGTHRMIRWGMILEDERKEPEPKESQYDWLDWRPVGPLTLSTRKVRVGDPGRMTVAFPDLWAGASFPDSVFTSLNHIRP